MKRYKFLAILLSVIIVLGAGCANGSGGGGSKNFIDITIKEYNLNSTAQTISVEVLSTVDVTIEIPADASWIQRSPATRKSPTSTIFVLNIEENASISRSSTITFSNVEATVFKTITITQQKIFDTTNIPITLTNSGELAQEVSALLSTEGGQVAAITKLTITGELLDTEDFNFLKTVTKLAILDISRTNTLEIPAEQFMDNATITQVLLPDSLTTIGEAAFRNSGLTSIIIPASVKTLGAIVFAECANLTEVILVDGLTTIGRSAFYESSVTNLTLPDSLITIEDIAFFGSSLESITIPSSLRTWGSFIFTDSANLTEVVLAEGLETIGRGAFLNTRVTSITIPASVTSLSDIVFLSCEYLTTVTLKNTTPPAIISDTFGFDTTTIQNIYVPRDSVNAYKAAPNWSTLANKISAIP